MPELGLGPGGSLRPASSSMGGLFVSSNAAAIVESTSYGLVQLLVCQLGADISGKSIKRLRVIGTGAGPYR
jgi:hypothetical protein